MSAKRLQLKLVSPVKTLFEEDVDGVTLPTTVGQITVLPHHMFLVSTLVPGELLVQNNGQTFPVAVAGGVIEVYNNHLVVLADSAEHVSDIDVQAAEQAAERLAKQLADEAKLDLTTYNALQKNLEFERIRAELGKKWRKI
ncbi:MAG: ATP synthase F1 subunit epsilon [Candidatus Kerfeldbacteria bacterium]|nr:ATP synthase F1 subunit epsilon [Candidatus Kerfeldbacteria bacterium]